jgi:hypothetical protein
MKLICASGFYLRKEQLHYYEKTGFVWQINQELISCNELK